MVKVSWVRAGLQGSFASALLQWLHSHLTERSLACMLQGIENYEREKALYDGIVLEYLELEDIVRNHSNPGGPYDSSLHTAPPKALAYLEWWWKCALRGPVLR